MIEHKRNRYQHLNRYWQEAFQRIDDKVKVIEGPENNSCESILETLAYRNDQLKKILKIAPKLKDGDIVVFTDAWDYSLLPLQYLRKELNVDIRIIGFWGDGFFSKDLAGVRQWNRFYKDKGTNWAKQFEKSIFQSTDFNCFKDEQLQIQFRIRYFPLMNYKESYVTGMPFGYLYDEGKDVDFSKKENIIVFPYELTEETQEWLFDSLKDDFPDWTFVTFAKTEAYKREQFRDLLRKAKVVFCANKHDVDPTVLFEAMCYGCWPFIPDHSAYKKIWPEKYRFPKVFTESKRKITLIRKKLVLIDLLQDVIDNYERRIPELKEDCEMIKDQFYNTDKFLEILKLCR